MATKSHAELAVTLLRDAAGFFRNVGEQNEHMKTQMEDNASVYEEVADRHYRNRRKVTPSCGRC